VTKEGTLFQAQRQWSQHPNLQFLCIPLSRTFSAWDLLQESPAYKIF
jgi:hypothetical protein